MKKRVIKFRGKRIDNGEWIYGDLIHWGENVEISSDGEPLTRTVIPETVGEFIGLTDKKDNEIFEDDVLYMWNTGMGKAIVKFMNGIFAFFVEETKYVSPIEPQYWKDAEVIGNIHDTPNILEQAGWQN